MNEMVERTGETAFLGTLTRGGHVQYLDKVVSPKVIRYDTEMAELRPAHATSIGKVMLAFLPEAEVAAKLRREGLPRLTPQTITSRSVFLDELARIRRDGVTVNVDERVVGAAGVAAPIRSASGQVIAALNLSAPTARFQQMRAQMTKAVVWAAEEISRHVGYRPAAKPPKTRRNR